MPNTDIIHTHAELDAAIEAAADGDTLTVQSIEGLGCNSHDGKTLFRRAGDRGIALQVLEGLATRLGTSLYTERSFNSFQLIMAMSVGQEYGHRTPEDVERLAAEVADLRSRLNDTALPIGGSTRKGSDMNNQVTVQDRIELYAKWTATAKDTTWRFRDARVNEFHKAMDRVAAWSDGAAHVHTEADIAAYLAERIDAEDTGSDARETYADMLNDVHTASAEAADLRAMVARLEAENESLRDRLADASAA